MKAPLAREARGSNSMDRKENGSNHLCADAGYRGVGRVNGLSGLPSASAESSLESNATTAFAQASLPLDRGCSP